jgi:hypothetical protein
MQRLKTDEMSHEEFLAELEAPLDPRDKRVSRRVIEAEFAMFKKAQGALGG